MRHDEDTSCAVLLAAVVIALGFWLFMPYVCMIAWDAIAAAWGLPTFTYWQWFFISWAIRWLFKSKSGGEVKT